MIQTYRLDEAAYRGGLDLVHDQKGNNDLLAITRPEVTAEITAGLLRRPAPTSSPTNTFNANRISQADYGAGASGARHQPRRRPDRARRRQCRRSDGRHARAWSPARIGPTNKTLSLSPDVNDPGYREIDFDIVKDVYREQVDAPGRRRRRTSS